MIITIHFGVCKIWSRLLWFNRFGRGYRRVMVTGITEHPNDAWMAQQARNLAIEWGDEPVKPQFLIHDRDTKFTAHFKALLAADDVECVRTSIRSPNQNAYAERWVQSLRTECLDHFIICGERHLRYLVARIVKFYNTLRPHQGRENLTLPEAIEADHEADDEPVILKFPTAERERPKATPQPVGKIKRHKFLGGLLSHYERVAA